MESPGAPLKQEPSADLGGTSPPAPASHSLDSVRPSCPRRHGLLGPLQHHFRGDFWSGWWWWSFSDSVPGSRKRVGGGAVLPPFSSLRASTGAASHAHPWGWRLCPHPPAPGRLPAYGPLEGPAARTSQDARRFSFGPGGRSSEASRLHAGEQSLAAAARPAGPQETEQSREGSHCGHARRWDTLPSGASEVRGGPPGGDRGRCAPRAWDSGPEPGLRLLLLRPFCAPLRSGCQCQRCQLVAKEAAFLTILVLGSGAVVVMAFVFSELLTGHRERRERHPKVLPDCWCWNVLCTCVMLSCV